jgi:hypothetical protein
MGRLSHYRVHAPHPRVRYTPVARLLVYMVCPGTYRGFVNIKTSLDNLVVPMDIVVLKGGIHAMPEQLDFGATVPGEVNEISIALLNSDKAPVVRVVLCRGCRWA